MATRKSTIKRPVFIEGDLAYIPLTKGYVAIIDAADTHLASGLNWQAMVVKHLVYAATGTSPRILLHRLITNAPHERFVDHKNGNGLDNRRNNLRFASCSDNQQNKRTSIANRSGYKGVHFHKNGGKWRAQISVNNKMLSLGLYETAEDAHAAYCEANNALHGEFGKTA